MTEKFISKHSSDEIEAMLDKVKQDMQIITYTQAEIESLLDKINVMKQPTKTSDLTNDDGFITNTVNNLANYYLKTETYTKEEISSLITVAASGGFIKVQELPTEDINIKAIYLVPYTGSKAKNLYEEYIYIDNDWEMIGTTKLDLSNYVTLTALNTALADYTTSTDLTTLLDKKQDKMQFETMPTADANYFSKIIQYTGVTNENYIQGHFYKCLSESITTTNPYATGYENCIFSHGMAMGEPQWLVFDNNESTKACIDGGGFPVECYAGYNFNTFVIPKSVYLNNRMPGMTDLYLQGSNDGETWENIQLLTSVKAAGADTYTITTEKAYKQLRIYCNSNAKAEFYTIRFTVLQINSYYWQEWIVSENINNLSSLSDTDVSSLEDGQILKYNSQTEKWENSNLNNGNYHIIDAEGNNLTQRNTLQFSGDLEATDDDENEKTMVAPHELTDEEMAEIMKTLPGSSTNLPVMFDERGTEYQVGWYVNFAGLKKPVYKKSFTGTTPSSKGAIGVAGTLQSVDKCTKIEGVVHGETNGSYFDYPINGGAGSDELSYCWYRRTAGELCIMIDGAIQLNKPFEITIQYTKSTDNYS